MIVRNVSHFSEKPSAMELLKSTRPLYKCLLFLFCLSWCQGQERISDVDSLLEIMDWIRSNGGWINEKVEVRSIDGQESLCGIFATQDLVWGEVIANIPWKLIFKVESEERRWCDTVENIRQSILHKDPKNQTPYERYLAQRSGGHIPLFWSNTSKELLTDLTEGLHTNGFFNDVDEWWREVCDRPGDEGHVRAMMLLQTRGDGKDIDLLVPFGDLLNHRNGKYTNVEPSIEHGKPYQMRTTRAVKAGEELVNSYNRCPWCDGLYSNPKDAYKFQVTPQLFELYGFVEPIPQRWVVPEVRMIFDINYADEDDPDDEEPEVDFIVPPSWSAFIFLRRRLAFLQDFEEELEDRTDIPKVELDGLRRFHDALVDAYSLALEFLSGEASERVWTMSEDSWYEEHDSDHTEL